MTPSPARTPPATIYILAFDQCDELDIVGPAAVLQTANRYLGDPTRTPPGEKITVKVVSVEG